MMAGPDRNGRAFVFYATAVLIRVNIPGVNIGPTSHEAVGLTDTASRRYPTSTAEQMDMVRPNACHAI